MLEEIGGARRMAEWMAYYRLEPWGGERGDLQAGVVASLVANALRKEGSEPLSPSDFLLRFGEGEDDQRADVADKVRRMFEMLPKAEA